MAIVNRDKDVSEQKECIFYSSASGAGASPLVTGITKIIAMVPYPCTLQSIGVGAFGVSSAMQVAFSKQYYAGGGMTVVGIGISNLVLQNMGVSGQIGYSGLAVPGSTLLNFNMGDQLILTTSVANSACSDLLLNIVLKKVQDIVSYNGVST